jgi:hypothetical protein
MTWHLYLILIQVNFLWRDFIHYHILIKAFVDALLIFKSFEIFIILEEFRTWERLFICWLSHFPIRKEILIDTQVHAHIHNTRGPLSTKGS